MPESRVVNVAVVMGGTSSEHDVSLNSGTNVCNALDKSKFNVKPVIIDKDGHWLVATNWLGEADKFSGFPPGIRQHTASSALTLLFQAGVDIVFIALHGPGGEDGLIQGFFETARMPYTASGVLGNAVGMDKILSKMVYLQNGIKTPGYLKKRSFNVSSQLDSLVKEIISTLGLPCVPKVSNQGSSHNVGIASTEAELRQMLLEFSQNGPEILVEEFIKGTELTCAVINKPGETESIALPPTELVPVNSEFFDYHAKYTPGATEEITPARISPEITARVQELAIRCHDLLHCGGMSRTDMMLRGEELFVIETNTIPGLTKTSLIPQAAAEVGIDFPSLLELQIRWAMEERGHWLARK
jgi:D-alanine-D-alanine ligase